ncbi:BgTH12-06168 [Blumeria graminis f. sp. triticale]|uniref:BgTH12-06168 n=1 Tax=Blumeria graminis f. sp. triticale TaxID=1689686 RepID=A0A9W4D516_BLUGR|nr:BgTH12-06168 [Blumeria graminis f. sp. triticale]
MSSLRHIFRGHSLWITAVFMILLISAHASLIEGRMVESTEPRYYCQKKIYQFSEVESVREAACNGFISIRKDSKRPLVHTEEDDDEKLIYEWLFPFALSKNAQGKERKNVERIIFNNSCELLDVLYYNTQTRAFESCTKVPDVPVITYFEMENVSAEPIVRCGSLSWEQTELQLHSTRNLPQFMSGFVEVKDTSSEVDGPWKRKISSKRVVIKDKPQIIFYEIIIDNQNQVRGVVVTHNISRKPSVAHNSNLTTGKTPTLQSAQKKGIIRLVCLLDNTFPLFSSTPISTVTSPKKQKNHE